MKTASAAVRDAELPFLPLPLLLDSPSLAG